MLPAATGLPRGASGSSKRMEGGSVGYSCRGPWGGLEISATISPTDLSFASSAISAWDNKQVVIVHDRQPPHLMLCHQVERV